MFELVSNTFYDNNNKLGRAVVIMNRCYHMAKIEFLYIIDESGNWSFHYENGTCLTAEERAELENWFITCA